MIIELNSVCHAKLHSTLKDVTVMQANNGYFLLCTHVTLHTFIVPDSQFEKKDLTRVPADNR